MYKPIETTKATLQAARERAYSMPLKDFHPGAPELFSTDTLWPYFERLRKEEPVHYCTNAPIEPYWSVTKYEDIVHVETSHSIFSSDLRLGGVMIRDNPRELPSFITMDEPRHSAQRGAVAPAFAPSHLNELAGLIRQRAGEVLDALPRNETFDFVDRVSIELTTQMLATLFDCPWKDRRKLARWSDLLTALPKSMIFESEEQRQAELKECDAYFTGLWNERINAEPCTDMLSMMAHHDTTRHMDHDNFLGNVFMLILGGNDTTRNAMTGAVIAFDQHPDQYSKLQTRPELVDSMVQEVIRWQSPAAHMRRTALMDAEIGGKLIRKGDRVVMWYVSGNRDSEAIDCPDSFVIDRSQPRKHLSFGFGIHRCVGLRLAELQLRIVWQEILKRFDRIEVVGEPKRVYSSFVRGYESLPVRIS